MLCLRFNNHSRYFKLDYEYKQDTNLFSLSVYIELMNPPYESLESILDANWNAVNIVRSEIERIRVECGLEKDPESQSETTIDGTPYDASSLIALQKSTGGEA